VLCQRIFSSVFRAVFLRSETAQFNLECMGPFRVYGALKAVCIFREEINRFFCRKFKTRTARTGGTEIFQNSNKYLKILGAKRGDIKRFYTKDPPYKIICPGELAPVVTAHPGPFRFRTLQLRCIMFESSSVYSWLGGVPEPGKHSIK